MLETLPPMSAKQFARLARIVHEDTGIYLAETKRGLLSARINRRLRALRLADYSAYCDMLDQPDSAEERRALLVAITTNVTAFFREAHHFDFLAQQVLPPLLAKARSGGRVRLWSAACSSGEEAYSIAMTVLEALPDAARHDIRILATDIDPDMVAKARAGRYSEERLHGLSSARRAKFFTAAPAGFAIRPEVSELLRFGELNLHKPWPFSGRFDVIFCRNVVIYFDVPMRQTLWGRFASVLNPDGYLMIGHSERIDGPAANRFRAVGTTAYKVAQDRADQSN